MAGAVVLKLRGSATANTGESLMKPVQAMRDLFASDEVAEANTTDRARIESRISRPIHISGYGREVHDFYATPDWVTEALLRHVQFRGRVWEPCCGSGAITTVLQRNGYDVTSTDITDHGFGTPGIDFLSRQVVPDGCRAIVTNPPYGGNGQSRKTQEKSAIAMLRFVDHALRLTETMQGQLALLVRFQWVAGQRAAALISAGPFAAVIALTHRIQWFGGTNISQKAGASSLNATADALNKRGIRTTPTTSFLGRHGKASLVKSACNTSREDSLFRFSITYQYDITVPKILALNP